MPDQRLTFITLGVDDLAAMKSWYQEKFWWTLMTDHEGVGFFHLGGVILWLFPSSELAKDAEVSSFAAGRKSMSLAINYRSEKEVDAAVKSLSEKGVRVIKTPQKTFWWGYHTYIEDIEWNLWEIAYNPFLEMDEHGIPLGHT